MEVSVISILVKSSYVLLVGAASITANHLVQYHHSYKSKGKTKKGKTDENRTTDQILKELHPSVKSD